MYENISIEEYLKKMEEWDNKRNSAAEDWVEKNWIPGDTFTYPNGVIIQYKDFRGEK